MVSVQRVGVYWSVDLNVISHWPLRRAEFEGNACCFSCHGHPTSRSLLCFGTRVPRIGEKKIRWNGVVFVLIQGQSREVLSMTGGVF